MFYIFTFLPQLAVTTSRTREIHSSADRKLIDKRRLAHVRTHSHTLSHRVLRQPDREVYIISLGGQPEQTQSFNFHDSLSEREKETERETERRKGRKPINENLKDSDKKDKHCIKMAGNVWKIWQIRTLISLFRFGRWSTWFLLDLFKHVSNRLHSHLQPPLISDYSGWLVFYYP